MLSLWWRSGYHQLFQLEVYRKLEQVSEVSEGLSADSGESGVRGNWEDVPVRRMKMNPTKQNIAETTIVERDMTPLLLHRRNIVY